MCSIGGFISYKPLDTASSKSLCRSLLWYGAERGSQSAGCYVNGQVLKRAVSPAEFIRLPELPQLFKSPVSIMLTHTRQPTSGQLGDAQAQPFTLGDTTIVHNGMIINTSDLKRRWNITKPSGVDSELVATFLATRGPTHFADFIESTEGVSAVAAVHNGQLYLMRSGNPTAYTKVTFEDNCVLVFASTPDILERAVLHTWLMPSDIKIQGTQQHVLLHATASKLKPISKKIRPTELLGYSYQYGPYGTQYDKVLDRLWSKGSKHRYDYLLTDGDNA